MTESTGTGLSRTERREEEPPILGSHASLAIAKGAVAALTRAHAASGLDVVTDHGLKGSLAEMGLADVLQTLQTLRKTGELTVSDGDRTALFVIDDGHLAGCRHPAPGVTLTSVLLELGLVTANRLEAANACQSALGREPRPLVTTLVELGYLSESAVVGATRALIESAVLDVLQWPYGTFAFERAEDDVRASLSHDPTVTLTRAGLSATEVVLNALRRLDDARAAVTTERLADVTASPAQLKTRGGRADPSSRPHRLTGKIVSIVLGTWLTQVLGAPFSWVRGRPWRMLVAAAALLLLVGATLLVARSTQRELPEENSCQPLTGTVPEPTPKPVTRPSATTASPARAPSTLAPAPATRSPNKAKPVAPTRKSTKRGGAPTRAATTK